MIDDKIKKWVDDAVKSGYSKEKIIQNLANFGYTKEDIELLTKGAFLEKSLGKNEENDIIKNTKTINELGFFKEILEIILKPNSYFKNQEKNIKESLFYLIKISLISSLFVLILLFSGYFIFRSFDILPLNFIKLISFKIILISILAIPFIFLLSTIASSFVSSSIIYLTLVLFKREAKFLNIYFSYAASLTPLLILVIINIIPILGTLVYAVLGIYSLYILVSGVSILEQISKLRSAFVILLPQIFLMFLFLPLIFIFKPSIDLGVDSSFNTEANQAQVNFCNPIFISLEKECRENEKIILNIRNNGISFSSFNYYINDKFANKEEFIFEPGKLNSLTLKTSLLEDKVAKKKFGDLKTIKIVPIANDIECLDKAATAFNPLQAC